MASYNEASEDYRVFLSSRDNDARPWIITWSSAHHLCRFTFTTRAEAEAVGRLITLGGMAPEPGVVHGAKPALPLLNLAPPLTRSDFDG